MSKEDFDRGVQEGLKNGNDAFGVVSDIVGAVISVGTTAESIKDYRDGVESGAKLKEEQSK